MRKEGHFYYWICIFRPKSSLLWSKSGGLKKTLRMEEFQKTFHYHFLAKNISFRYIFHFEYVNHVCRSTSQKLAEKAKNVLAIQNLCENL
jgi:hypothetical protein